MFQLAQQIKELPVELIAKILNNLAKKKYYINTFYDESGLQFFDSLEHAVIELIKILPRHLCNIHEFGNHIDESLFTIHISQSGISLVIFPNRGEFAFDCLDSHGINEFLEEIKVYFEEKELTFDYDYVFKILSQF